jgi:5-deoxy-glucuronate isomerase
MSHLLVKKNNDNLTSLDITPASANWRYVGFALQNLKAGSSVSFDTGTREVLVVIVGGMVTVKAGQALFEKVGQRETPFKSSLPYAVYVPPGHTVEVTAETDAEVAQCSAEDAEGKYPIRLVTPDDMIAEDRGEGSNQRRIHNILMLDQVAERLLVTEVITPSGNWSSYPPHKHDTDELPRESYLEETYYHRIDPASGFVFQRVYNDDRSLDETISAGDGDCVLVPEGYHPVGVPHGYTSYYLNVMAGPKRAWKFHNDPDHEWIFEAQQS